MGKILYLVTFLVAAPVTLAASLLALNVLETHEKEQSNLSPVAYSIPEAGNYGAKVYASLPSQVGQVKGVATGQDARFEILKQYLERYNSPLVPHTQDLLNAADRHDLDFRLLVAIAQQESNLCKKIPENSFNCWGWGIHAKGTLRFPNYPEGIDTVARGIKLEYIDKGYDTPEKIMQKYTPHSNGSWAAGVSQFLSEME